MTAYKQWRGLGECLPSFPLILGSGMSLPFSQHQNIGVFLFIFVWTSQPKNIPTTVTVASRIERFTTRLWHYITVWRFAGLNTALRAASSPSKSPNESPCLGQSPISHWHGISLKVKNCSKVFVSIIINFLLLDGKRIIQDNLKPPETAIFENLFYQRSIKSNVENISYFYNSIEIKCMLCIKAVKNINEWQQKSTVFIIIDICNKHTP